MTMSGRRGFAGLDLAPRLPQDLHRRPQEQAGHDRGDEQVLVVGHGATNPLLVGRRPQQVVVLRQPDLLDRHWNAIEGPEALRQSLDFLGGITGRLGLEIIQCAAKIDASRPPAE